MIRITSKKEGFRRCGIEHSTEPKLYANNQFNKTKLEILKDEPMLVIEEDIPASDKSSGNNKTDKEEDDK